MPTLLGLYVRNCRGVVQRLLPTFFQPYARYAKRYNVHEYFISFQIFAV